MDWLKKMEKLPALPEQIIQVTHLQPDFGSLGVAVVTSQRAVNILDDLWLGGVVVVQDDKISLGCQVSIVA